MNARIHIAHILFCLMAIFELWNANASIVPNEFSSCKDILFRLLVTIRRPVCCSRVTYYSMPARLDWSCATYKRFLHLASQVFTKYTARGLEFSQKERLVCARGFVEIFPPAAFLILSCLFLFVFSLLPRGKQGGTYCRIVSCRVRWNGLKEEGRHGLHERNVGSYFVMPNSHMNTETDAASQSRFTKD